jgi:hypothetical protein
MVGLSADIPAGGNSLTRTWTVALERKHLRRSLFAETCMAGPSIVTFLIAAVYPPDGLVDREIGSRVLTSRESCAQL